MEQGVLNASFYWVGLSRVNSSSPFRWVTSERVPTTPRRFPYAHWTWFQVGWGARGHRGAWGVVGMQGGRGLG
jgi:hypothetical protein